MIAPGAQRTTRQPTGSAMRAGGGERRGQAVENDVGGEQRLRAEENRCGRCEEMRRRETGKRRMRARSTACGRRGTRPAVNRGRFRRAAENDTATSRKRCGRGATPAGGGKRMRAGGGEQRFRSADDHLGRPVAVDALRSEAIDDRQERVVARVGLQLSRAGG